MEMCATCGRPRATGDQVNDFEDHVFYECDSPGPCDHMRDNCFGADSLDCLKARDERQPDHKGGKR